MGLTYNITDDYLYQEGLAKGEQKGREEKRVLIMEMLLDRTLTIEKIAALAKVSAEYVRQIEELKK